MRVTNKMMSNNTQYNINMNKAYLDELSQQQATQRKVINPSDDPVTAIRGLRFESSLASITQYLERNVSDAISWTDITQTSIDKAQELAREMSSEYSSASSDFNKVSDRSAYLDNLKALAKEFYQTGNTKNDNRYLFTGYRTSDSLTFSEKDIEERKLEAVNTSAPFKYECISEIFDKEDVESYSFLKGAMKESDVDDANNTAYSETSVKNIDVFRIRLAYDDIDSSQTASTGAGSTTQDVATDAVSGGKVSLTTTVKTLTLYNENGTSTGLGGPYTVNLIDNDEDAASAATDKAVYLNYKTGNLIFGDDVRSEIMEAAHITFGYNKSSWDAGDVKPEHYFCCYDTGSASKGTISYMDYQQEIEYNVRSGQSLKINTNARDLFDLGVGRAVDDLEEALNAVSEAEAKVAKLQEMLDDPVKYENTDKVQMCFNAAQKELDYANQRLESVISANITSSGKYYDKVNLAGTSCGTTIKRLEIVKNRLVDNYTTVETQASENNNVQLTDVVIDINEANMVYTSALMVTGKIAQQSLLNYI